VGDRADQRRLWHAIDHATNAMPAYVFGRRKDQVFLMPKTPPEPYNIARHHADDRGTCQPHPDPDKHEVGKRNTQKTGRKNLNFGTRIKRLNRKAIGFPKPELLHDAVIGLLINKVEFGLDIHA